MPHFKLTDDQLMDLVRLNDNEAYQALLVKYNRNSYYIAKKYYSMNPHSGISLEALHNVALMAFYTALKKYDGKETFYPYWITIAEHAIVDYIQENSYDYKASQYAGLSLDSVIGERENSTAGDTIGEADPVIMNYGQEDYLTKLAESGQQFRQIEKDLIELLVENYKIDEICKILDIDQTRFRSIVKSIRRKLAVVNSNNSL